MTTARASKSRTSTLVRIVTAKLLHEKYYASCIELGAWLGIDRSCVSRYLNAELDAFGQKVLRHARTVANKEREAPMSTITIKGWGVLHCWDRAPRERRLKDPPTHRGLGPSGAGFSEEQALRGHYLEPLTARRSRSGWATPLGSSPTEMRSEQRQRRREQ